jgi:hypothetical protein
VADEFTRRKLNWLDRAMHDARLKPSEKLVAWKISYHLNRTTLDCWPAQATMAADLNIDERTVRRAVPRLESLGYIRVDLSGRQLRYAPILEAEDDLPLEIPDKFVSDTGQKCTYTQDTDVPLTPLSNTARTPSIRGREKKAKASASDQASDEVIVVECTHRPKSWKASKSDDLSNSQSKMTLLRVLPGGAREQKITNSQQRDDHASIEARLGAKS